MRSLERRFKREQDKNPHLSSLVVFGNAVKNQRFSERTISVHFLELVDKDDYQREDIDEILEHMLRLSHSEKPSDDPENTA